MYFFDVFHTLYHPCSFVRISSSFQDLLKIFLQDSQKSEDLKILEVVNIYTTGTQRVKKNYESFFRVVADIRANISILVEFYFSETFFLLKS